MNLHFQENCNNIDWNKIPALLKEVGMSYIDAIGHKKSFEASYAVIFAFDNQDLVGCGRMLSDGIRQSALYDIAISPDYQGMGIGKDLVNRLMQKTPDCNFMLYASPGKESFYKKLNFKRMKTGMILFSNKERMSDCNFVINE